MRTHVRPPAHHKNFGEERGGDTSTPLTRAGSRCCLSAASVLAPRSRSTSSHAGAGVLCARAHVGGCAAFWLQQVKLGGVVSSSICTPLYAGGECLTITPTGVLFGDNSSTLAALNRGIAPPSYHDYAQFLVLNY